jgi:hypothetical protein
VGEGEGEGKGERDGELVDALNGDTESKESEFVREEVNDTEGEGEVEGGEVEGEGA